MPKSIKRPPSTETAPLGRIVGRPKPAPPPPRTYEDSYPRSEGPPPCLNGASAAIYDDQTDFYTVYLDRGALQRVWELMEAEARRTFPTRETMPSARAANRAVHAFRHCWARKEQP